MTRFRAVALSLLALAPPVAAQDRAAVIDILTEALVASGCDLTETEAEPILTGLGLTRDSVRDASQAMIDEGRATLADGVLRLTAAHCPLTPATPAPDELLAVVLDAFRGSDCTLTQQEVLAAVAAAGLTEDQMQIIGPQVQAMEEAGQIVTSDDQQTATLDPAICAGAAPVSGPRETVLRIFAENGCVLPPQELARLAGDYGLEDEAAREMVRLMTEAGEIATDGEGDRLAEGLCIRAPADPALPRNAAVIDIFAAAGCRLDRAELSRRLADLDLSPEEGGAFLRRVDALLRLGQMTEDAEGLSLGADLCAPAPTPAASDDLAVLLNVFRANMCYLPRDGGIAVLNAAGLSTQQLAAMEPQIQRLLSAGDLVQAPDASGTWLSDAVCGDAVPPRAERFVRVLRDAGCRATAEGLSPMMEAAGLHPSTFDELAGLLVETALAGRIGAEVVLAPQICDPTAAPPDLRLALIAALAARDCRMAEDEALAILPTYGLTLDETEPLVRRMIAAGEAIFADGVLVIAPSLCRIAG